MDARVLITGNLGGVAYTHAKFLRKRNIYVDLFIWNWEMKKDTRNPLKTDTSIHVLPDWIHTFSDTKFIFGEYRKIAKNYDIVHAFNTDPIYAQFTGRPFISHPVGSDAREFAFGKGIHPALLRRAYRKNDVFFIGAFDYYDNVIDQLKVKNPVYLSAIQSLDIIPEKDCQVPERDGAEELFFHPTSHDFLKKGTGLLIEAYARYVKKICPRSKMVMIEWGEDLEKSKKLISELNISDNVIFKKWLNKQDVYNYMFCSDLIFDQFIVSSSSTIERETCAMGKPVVKFMDKKWFKAYEELPFAPAGTVDEIYDVLVNYHKQPEIYRKLGQSAKAYVAKHNHWEPVTDSIIAEYDKILDKRSR